MSEESCKSEIVSSKAFFEQLRKTWKWALRDTLHGDIKGNCGNLSDRKMNVSVCGTSPVQLSHGRASVERLIKRCSGFGLTLPLRCSVSIASLFFAKAQQFPSTLWKLLFIRFPCIRALRKLFCIAIQFACRVVTAKPVVILCIDGITRIWENHFPTAIRHFQLRFTLMLCKLSFHRQQK